MAVELLLIGAALLACTASGATLRAAGDRGDARLVAGATLLAVARVAWPSPPAEAALVAATTVGLVAFAAAFPARVAPRGALMTAGAVAAVLGTAAAVSPPIVLAAVVGAAVVATLALAGARYRRTAHPRGAALLLASGSTIGAGLTVQALATAAPLWGATFDLGGSLPAALVAAGTVGCGCTLAYALAPVVPTLARDAFAIAVPAAAVGAVAYLLAPVTLVPITVTSAGALAIVVGVIGRATSEPTSLPDDKTLPRQTRETLVALERLTDPLAVQERVVEALTQLLPGAQLELMRASTAPVGALARARSVDTELARAAAARGVLVRHQIDELDGPARDAFARLDVDLAVPAMAGPVLYGVLTVRYGAVTRETVRQARRFADLLALKLETHRLYAELETHKRMASLGTLTAALAHDLRTPLSTIRLNLQMLRQHAEALGDDAECLQLALQGVDRLGAEIETLLDFSRPLELAVAAVHPTALARETAHQVAGKLADKGVSLRTEVPEALPPIRGDLSRLVRVFANLVDNAVHASQPGSTVTMCATADDDTVEVSVRDEGQGIPGEDLRRIFDPFFTRNADGTGLGLAISRKIVQAHGGRIRVESNVGRGTVFTVDLPRAR